MEERQSPEMPPEEQSPEDFEDEKIAGIFSDIKGRLARANEAGITAGRNRPTNFARGEYSSDIESRREIIKSTNNVLNLITRISTSRPIPLESQGDIRYDWENESKSIIASALIPNPEDPHQDTTEKVLRIKFDTWGEHDIDLLVTNERRFQLKIFFNPEDPEGRLVYNSGKKGLARATREEAEIMKSFLKHADKSIN